MRVCSIDGCGRKHFGRGWCNAHYARWRDHGDPLAGGTPRGYSQGSARTFLEEVVMNHTADECLTWPFSTYNTGYPQIRIEGKNQSVTRLVCERVHGAPPTPEHDAAHSCGKGHKACCSPVHLSWKTRIENVADQIEHGTRLCGEKQNGAKLTADQVVEIRNLRGRLTQREIAAQFGIQQATVGNIQRREIWSHVQ